MARKPCRGAGHDDSVRPWLHRLRMVVELIRLGGSIWVTQTLKNFANYERQPAPAGGKAPAFLLRLGLVIFVPVLVIPILRRLDIRSVHHELQNGSRMNLVQQFETSLYKFPRGDSRATHED
jgi:hypothetical protein